MKRFVSAGLLVLSLCVSAFGAERVGGTVEYHFDLSGQAAGEAVDLWIPYPVSDAHQQITDVRIEGNAENAQVTTDRTFSTPMLHARWDAGQAERSLVFSFKVERADRRLADLDELSDSSAPCHPDEYDFWLRPTRNGPTDGAVAELAAEITKGKTGVLAKARAIYDWTCENTFRNPDTRGCGEGDVCRLLENPGGKCTDIHSVFVSLARAAGVPAREVFGIRQGREDGQEITTWQHCWAEFYLPGTGWVAVDPGDVRKMMLKRGLTPEDPVPADLRAAYWGGVEPYRVRLGIGRDLTLNPPQQGEPVNYLMYPFAQVGGKTVDWLDPQMFRYKILYRKGT